MALTRRACTNCGTTISRYANPTDRYCFACHPTVEKDHDDYCREGHDQTIHGVRMLNGSGRLVRRCGACRQQQQRRYTINRTKKYQH